MQDVKRKCKSDFWSAYAAELVFWPAFQAVNFWKVPLRHQLLAVNLACLLDATFLCWYAHCIRCINKYCWYHCWCQSMKERLAGLVLLPPHACSHACMHSISTHECWKGKAVWEELLSFNGKEDQLGNRSSQLAAQLLVQYIRVAQVGLSFRRDI